MARLAAEGVALVGLRVESLDLIHRIRESGRGEVRLLADPDPRSRSHSLAAAFRVPSTRELSQVAGSGCSLVVLPEPSFEADTWQPRWREAGLRCISLDEAVARFSTRTSAAASARVPAPEFQDGEPGRARSRPAPASPTAFTETISTAAQEAAAPGEPPVMTTTSIEHELRTSADRQVLFPASMRASATHLQLFMEELRAQNDAGWGHAYLWDDVLGDLVGVHEILGGEAHERVPGEWAQRWVRRAWTERRPLVFQESLLEPDGDLPARSRAFLALPLGDEGILYLEDAWLSSDPRAAERVALSGSCRRWAESLAASRMEQRSLLRARLAEKMGRAVYDLLPEGDYADPWPNAAEALAELVEADSVVFHFPDGGVVTSARTSPGQLPAFTRLLGGRSGEALRAVPLLAARSRGSEGQIMREAGIASFLGWARGEGPARVAVGAFRSAGPDADEFDPEHLVALKKLLSLAGALSKASQP